MAIGLLRNDKIVQNFTEVKEKMDIVLWDKVPFTSFLSSVEQKYRMKNTENLQYLSMELKNVVLCGEFFSWQFM